ncbi:MAG: hypothetical protein HY784_02150, partial [Chloroflexi bacterium]|nr:hypothetical protein [Chloroflexota bacterium]
MADIANDGLMPAPRLVSRTQCRDGFHLAPPLGQPIEILSPQLAEEIASRMARAAETETGARAGMAETSSAGHFAIAHTSAVNGRVAWFIGFRPAASPRFAVALAVEDSTIEEATTIGLSLLLAATP